MSGEIWIGDAVSRGREKADDRERGKGEAVACSESKARQAIVAVVTRPSIGRIYRQTSRLKNENERESMSLVFGMRTCLCTTITISRSAAAATRYEKEQKKVKTVRDLTRG